MAQPVMYDVRPASEDPYGDPGLQEFAQAFGQPNYGPQHAEEHFDQLWGNPALQQA